MDWNGKVAFITGGVSGIGFGLARAFARAGVQLALSYRNEEHRAEAEQWFRDQGKPAPLFVNLDVTDRERFAAVAEGVESHFGKVHVIANNAGVSVFAPTDEATYDDYDWIMGVNFGGVVNSLVNFIARIKRHGEGGYVLNVASMAAFISGSPGCRLASIPPVDLHLNLSRGSHGIMNHIGWANMVELQLVFSEAMGQ